MWASWTRPPRRFCRTCKAPGEGPCCREREGAAVRSLAQPSLAHAAGRGTVLWHGVDGWGSAVLSLRWRAILCSQADSSARAREGGCPLFRDPSSLCVHPQTIGAACHSHPRLLYGDRCRHTTLAARSAQRCQLAITLKCIKGSCAVAPPEDDKISRGGPPACWGTVSGWLPDCQAA